jgi:hypothetical protein
MVSNIVAERLAVLPHIREEPDSNLGPVTGYSDSISVTFMTALRTHFCLISSHLFVRYRPL